MDKESIIEFYQERAAIFEYDDNQSRLVAEYKAKVATMEEFDFTRQEMEKVFN